MSLSEKIAKGIGIDAQYVEFIAKRNNLYARYFIDKKGGGKREILQPSKELKVIQRWLNKNFFIKFPVSVYSQAYSKGDSVRKNALIHKDARYMLHTDITNFFPTITREMLVNYLGENIGIVKEWGLTINDVKLILDICLYKGEHLVVGSVASPRIANMIMYKFDLELQERLDAIGPMNYTRYADDIVISSKDYIDETVIDLVSELLDKYGFTMNRKKTYFMNRKCKRAVTGVVIDNNSNKLSVGNKKYKMIERMIYKYLVKGEGNLAYINGYLSYIKELNYEQYNQIKNIYKRYDKEGKIFELI